MKIQQKLRQTENTNVLVKKNRKDFFGEKI